MGTQRAYTLSELLVAIAILGLLATFAIPKLLQDVQTQQNKAKFKEAIALLEDKSFEAYQLGLADNDRWEYILEKINAIKVCGSNGISQGCTATLSGDGSVNEPSERAFVLHNGVVIGGFSSASGQNQFHEPEGLIIDINGTQAPNTYGQDVLWIQAPRFLSTGQLSPNCSSRRLICPYGNGVNITASNLYRSLF